jgi:Tannase and feruloyl esterase
MAAGWCSSFSRDANCDVPKFDPSQFTARLREVSALMGSTDADLSAFAARGGRLIMYENIADYAQSPYAGIEYYKSVVERLGQASVTDFMRLYVTPGQTIWASARHPASTYSKGSSRRSKEERRQAISYNSIKLRNRHSQCSRRAHVPLSGLPSLCRRGCHQEGERVQNAVGHSRTARLGRRADAAIEFAWTRWHICSRGWHKTSQPKPATND